MQRLWIDRLWESRFARRTWLAVTAALLVANVVATSSAAGTASTSPSYRARLELLDLAPDLPSEVVLVTRAPARRPWIGETGLLGPVEVADRMLVREVAAW
jgi:hypothetical protein